MKNTRLEVANVNTARREVALSLVERFGEYKYATLCSVVVRK